MSINHQVRATENNLANLDALKNRISAKARSVICTIANTEELACLKSEFDVENNWDNTIDFLAQDVLAFVEKDPASRNDPELVLNTYISFDAVLHYRLARYILSAQRLTENIAFKLAMALSNRAKSITGIDIHPSAKIGKNFILDHGYGTVIGETCEIGDNCYILAGVVLGSLCIANNPSSKRHPTIGDNVEIGGSASVLGNITVGDHVFIAPHCVITSDVPSDSKVSIVNQLQVSKTNRVTDKSSRRIQIYGIVPMPDKCVIYGIGFFQPEVHIVDDRYRILEQYTLNLNYWDASTLIIEFTNFSSNGVSRHGKLHLYIVDSEESIILLSPFISRGYMNQNNNP